MRSRTTESFAKGAQVVPRRELYLRDTRYSAGVRVRMHGLLTQRLDTSLVRSLALIGIARRECHSARSRRATFAHAAMHAYVRASYVQARNDTHRLCSATKKVDIDAFSPPCLAGESYTRSDCVFTHART